MIFWEVIFYSNLNRGVSKWECFIVGLSTFNSISKYICLDGRYSIAIRAWYASLIRICIGAVNFIIYMYMYCRFISVLIKYLLKKTLSTKTVYLIFFSIFIVLILQCTGDFAHHQLCNPPSPNWVV